eukprot:gene18216-25627_t
MPTAELCRAASLLPGFTFILPPSSTTETSMTNTEEYLSRSRLFRRLRSGTHGRLIELYAARLVEIGLARPGTWRSLNVVGNLLAWMAIHRVKLSKLNEPMVERY